MFADMDDRICTEVGFYPMIESDVLMRWDEIGSVVVEIGIFVVAACGLDTDEDVAELDAGDGVGGGRRRL